MRFRTFALVMAVVAMSGLTAERAARADGIAIGDATPMGDRAMKSVNGKDVTIDAVKGAKGTLVVFTCNHCPWAQAWETRIVELGNSYQKKGIGVIAINSNDPEAYPEDSYETMQQRAKQRKIAYPYVVDETSDVARAFGASKTPEVFLFDASGKLVYHGAVDDNAKEPKKVTSRWLRDALAAVAAGKPVALAETKAFGCGIKYRKEAS